MKNKRNVFQSFSMVIQFGLNMLVPIVMCTMAGVWLGEKLDIKVMAVPARRFPQYLYYGEKDYKR